jgi:hypothetical protein
MATITPTRFKVVHFWETLDTLTSEAITDRAGQLLFCDTTTGKAEPATADDVANFSPLLGFATTDAKSNLASESVTLLIFGVVDLGRGVLSSYDIGAKVYLADDGTLDSTAGTEPVIVGTVIPVYRHDGSYDKLLRVDTRAFVVLAVTAN